MATLEDRGVSHEEPWSEGEGMDYIIFYECDWSEDVLLDARDGKGALYVLTVGQNVM